MSLDNTDSNQRIKVISRAANILRLLGSENGGLSLGQIAKQVELPRSTVQRIVSALASEGFICKSHGNGNIRLGAEIQNLAKAGGQTMKSRLQFVMKNLSEETGETVDLAILENKRLRFIEQIEGSQRLRTVSKIGETFPLTTTANGKAALACLNNVAAETLIRSEMKGNGQANLLLQHLMSELEAVRAGTLAEDENEHTEGICAVGIALKDENGDVFALSIPVPTTRYHRVKHDLHAAVKRHRNQLQLR